MLVAYGPNEHPVIAEEMPLELLQQWSRERVLCCPNCRGMVHVRGPDKRAQIHFAHQRGKVVLAQWVREQVDKHAVGYAIAQHRGKNAVCYNLYMG